MDECGQLYEVDERYDVIKDEEGKSILFKIYNVIDATADPAKAWKEMADVCTANRK